ncbi:hypothetical protein IAT38_003535 [Cryptococcus sp. DSM 104549]
MAQNYSLEELVGRAYTRALPPKKLVKLLQARFDPSAGSPATEDELASVLIRRLLPSPPSLVLTYLGQLLASHLLTTKTVIIHLLFEVSSPSPPPTQSLVAIANTLLSSFSGLSDTDSSIFPSLLTNPSSPSAPPDIGTSASATPPPNQTSTLALLLPLLRLIAGPSPPPALTALTAHILTHLSPFPAAGLDIGLEAGALLDRLPDEICAPLGGLLGGMAGPAQGPSAEHGAHRPAGADAHAHGMTGDVQMVDGSLLQAHPHVQSHAHTHERLPLRQTVAFLLAHAHRASRWTGSPTSSEEVAVPPLVPPVNYTRLVQLGRHLTSSAEEFVGVLVQVAIENLVGHQGGDGGGGVSGNEGVRDWGYVVEGLPRLLKWWKNQGEDGVKWAFPGDLAGTLAGVFQQLLPAMETYSQLMAQTYETVVQTAEADDESSGFTPPEGWQLLSLQESFVGKLVQLGLISSDEATVIAPGVTVHAFSPGESLLARLESESRSHLPPLVHIISFAYGAAPSFGAELVKVIQSTPQTPPSENFYIHISSQPPLLASLGTTLPPCTLLSLMVEHLLGDLDESARADDPQGYLTRFGEGVVLVENFVKELELPLPDLLFNARQAVSYGLLPDELKECLNGWVKAIFGSDGIEDQILLATSPSSLCTLIPTLIQQAIAAVAVGQIDEDTLHSGLSYFAQPLLRWCLGGVVGWLCSEIERLGGVSGLHLVVLQDIVMGHACPEQLLRVNGPALHRILDPSSGLQEVLGTSGFDVESVRAKLDMLGAVAVHPAPATPLLPALQTINHLSLAPPTWPVPFLQSLAASLSAPHGTTTTLRTTLHQSLLPSLSPSIPELASATSPSLLRTFAPILLAVDQEGKGPLIAELPNWLSSVLDGPIEPGLSESQLASLVIDSMRCAQGLWSTEALGTPVIQAIVDELVYQSDRPLAPADSTRSPVQVKKRRRGDAELVSAEHRALVIGVIKALRDDEEFRSVWGDVVARLDRI